jgi:hypothetical protein
LRTSRRMPSTCRRGTTIASPPPRRRIACFAPAAKGAAPQ